jgi:hypothetical protein
MDQITSRISKLTVINSRKSLEFLEIVKANGGWMTTEQVSKEWYASKGKEWTENRLINSRANIKDLIDSGLLISMRIWKQKWVKFNPEKHALLINELDKIASMLDDKHEISIGSGAVKILESINEGTTTIQQVYDNINND